MEMPEELEKTAHFDWNPELLELEDDDIDPYVAVASARRAVPGIPCIALTVWYMASTHRYVRRGAPWAGESWY